MAGIGSDGRQRRVLHVLKGLGPGGAERLIVSLTEARPPDLDVHVAHVLPAKTHLVPELEAAGATVHLLAGVRGFGDPRWPLRLGRLERALAPDIVHVHSPAVAAVARPLLRARRHRPGLVSTEHNLWPSFSTLTRVSNGLTLPLSDVCLAVSDDVRASAWRPFRKRIDVLVQGVPVGRLAARRAERTAARAELGIEPEQVLVVIVANFREKKDYPTLLAAAEAAVEADPSLRFVSVGQGPLEGAIRSQHAQTGLGATFEFLGYHPDPPRVLAAADIFTLTSRFEGLPVALLEAMALGLPAVVSAVGGVPQVVRDGVEGVLVPAGDVGQFAAAYVTLARDPDRRRGLAEAASDRAAEFDVTRSAAQLDLVYRKVGRPRTER